MQANGKIAIYNATRKQLHEVDSNLQVQNYWRTLRKTERVYLLEDYAFVDKAMLKEYEHEQFVEDGWEVLQ